YTMLIECEKNIWEKFNVVTLMTSLEKHQFYGLMDFLRINSCVYFSSIKALEDNQRTFLKRSNLDIGTEALYCSIIQDMNSDPMLTILKKMRRLVIHDSMFCVGVSTNFVQGYSSVIVSKSAELLEICNQAEKDFLEKNVYYIRLAAEKYHSLTSGIQAILLNLFEKQNYHDLKPYYECIEQFEQLNPAYIAVPERMRYTSTERSLGTHRLGQLTCTSFE
ncbi:MAG: hypothetical protein ACOYM4_18755, partial [Nodosilinea sp.]